MVLSGAKTNLTNLNANPTVSDRKFGLVVGGIFIAIAVIRFFLESDLTKFSLVAGSLGLILVTFGTFKPQILKPANYLWNLLGILLHNFTNPIIIFALYFFCIVPIGVLMRAFGKDLLSLKFDKTRPSYWIPRLESPNKNSYERQF